MKSEKIQCEMAEQKKERARNMDLDNLDLKKYKIIKIKFKRVSRSPRSPQYAAVLRSEEKNREI